MDCPFCKIISGETPSYSIYENDLVKVIMDVKPSTDGDCLLIPKKHVVTIREIDQKLYCHFLEIQKQIYDLLKEKLHCQGLTFVQNNDHGQEVKHFHIHMTPRYLNDHMDHCYDPEQLSKLEIVYHKIKDQQTGQYK